MSEKHMYAFPTIHCRCKFSILSLEAKASPGYGYTEPKISTDSSSLTKIIININWGNLREQEFE